MGKLGLKGGALAALALAAGLAWARLTDGGGDDPDLVTRCWAGLAGSAALGLFTWALALAIPGPLAQLMQLSRPERPLSAGNLALALAGTLGLSLGMGWLLSGAGFFADGPLAPLSRLLAEATGAAMGAAILAMALAPALAEELLFRGLLLGRFCERLGTPGGLLLSSGLFALIHADLGQALAAFPLGLYLGALTLRTGSVHTAILCHAVNNGAAIALARFQA